jgi:signal peptidase I
VCRSPRFPTPMRKFARIAGHFIRLLWVVAVTVAMSVLLLIGLGPPTGVYQIRTVLTGSMRPTMPEGSVVMIRPVAPEDLRLGDVITYRIPVDDRRIVTHRIVDITEPGARPVVRTKGDANKAPDPWVARIKDEHAWRVQVSVRRVGYVLASLRQPAVRQLMVLGAPGLLAVASLIRIWMPSKRDEVPVPVEVSEERPHRGRATHLSGQRRPAELSNEDRWQEWRVRRVRPRAGDPTFDG